MLRYRLVKTADPEERLEDAAMWKALHDVFDDNILIYDDAPWKKPEWPKETVAAGLAPADPQPPKEKILFDDDILLGRQRSNEVHQPSQRLTSGYLKYWNDPVFIEASGRRFEMHDLDGALKTVRSMHAEGKGAFLKAIWAKYFVSKVPVGTDPMDVIDSLAYSFADAGDCLMVQELVEMTCETRFAVMNRQIVSLSPVACWLTPLDTPAAIGCVSRTPAAKTLEKAPEIVASLTAFATDLATRLEAPDCILDCAMVDGRPVAIELNPLVIGGFGLYAMDVHAIARGVRDILLPRLELQNRAQPTL